MSNPTPTPTSVPIGIGPQFARFIEQAVLTREADFVLGRQDTDREQRLADFRNLCVTYLIGHEILDRGLEGNITDYALVLKPTERET